MQRRSKSTISTAQHPILRIALPPREKRFCECYAHGCCNTEKLLVCSGDLRSATSILSEMPPKIFSSLPSNIHERMIFYLRNPEIRNRTFLLIFVYKYKGKTTMRILVGICKTAHAGHYT
jgi:hypothetical protein